MDPRKLGGIVTKSLTVQRQTGSSTPRMAETPSGLLWDTGQQNEGMETFRATELQMLLRIGVPVLMSIAGTSVEEFVHLTVAVDTDTFRPKLAAVTGGLSGPALLPITVRAVHEVATALPKVPILGVGGVCTAHDAVELMLAGAWAVQVGTALFSNPMATL